MHSRTLALAALACMLFLSLGFNNPHMYTWPLLALSNIFHFLGILLCVVASNAVRVRTPTRLILLACIALLLMLTNADWGTIYITAILIPMGLAFAASRDRAYLRTMLLLVLILVTYQLSMRLILTGAHEGVANDAAGPSLHLLQSPLDALATISIGLVSGIFNAVYIRNAFPQLTLPLVLGAYLMFALYVATFIAYFWRRLYTVSLVPPALMLMGIGVVLPALVFRWILIPDQWGLAVVRYAPAFKLAIAGMIWALWLVIEDLTRPGRLQRPGVIRGVAIICITVLLAGQTIQVLLAWRSVPQKQMVLQSNALGIYETADSPQLEIPSGVKGISGSTDSYRVVLDYLRDNRMNVFFPGYATRGAFARHVSSRLAFTAAQEGIPTPIPSVDSGELPVAGKDWRVDTSGTVLVIEPGEHALLRISAQTPATGARHLLTRTTAGAAEEILLFHGSQHLYYELEKGTSHRFELTPGAGFQALEIRVAKPGQSSADPYPGT
ncbi:MAG: hypothetical protein ACPG1A_02845 [Halioglobus sp.]